MGSGEWCADDSGKAGDHSDSDENTGENAAADSDAIGDTDTDKDSGGIAAVDKNPAGNAGTDENSGIIEKSDTVSNKETRSKCSSDCDTEAEYASGADAGTISQSDGRYHKHTGIFCIGGGNTVTEWVGNG